MLYLDTAFIVKLYADEPDCEIIRELVITSTAPVASSAIARVETAAALHRKVREGAMTMREYNLLLDLFAEDQRAGRFHWLPLSEAVLVHLERVMRRLSPSLWLSAADALHLATAAEAGFREIHSNDARLLAAASRFKLKGVDPLRKQAGAARRGA